MAERLERARFRAIRRLEAQAGLILETAKATRIDSPVKKDAEAVEAIYHDIRRATRELGELWGVSPRYPDE